MQALSLHYTAIPRHPCQELAAGVLPWLPPVKRAAVERKRQPVDRNATLLGVALLARACDALGRVFDAGQLRFPDGGKPMLVGGPHFSISHAGGLVACLVDTESPVGVDLEEVSAVRWEDVDFLFGTEARERLVQSGWTPARVWVAMEATLKAAGRGLADAAAVRLDGPVGRIDDQHFYLRFIEVSDRHASCVASPAAARLDALTMIRHSAMEVIGGLPGVAPIDRLKTGDLDA